MLDQILAAKRKRLDRQKINLTLETIKDRVSLSPAPRNFRQALLGKNLSIIAEIKKASPSLGDIVSDIDIKKIAIEYEQGGAAAISVLTEEDYFKGNPSFIKEVKKSVRLPVLRKDFIFEPYQVYESRYLGADALLLIASILDKETLASLTKLALNLNVEPLVEIHSEEDLIKALATKTKIIGINNRDLETFKTDLSVTKKLKGKIESGRVVVSESGIKTKEDAEKLKALKVDAILIGESLVKSDNIKQKLQDLIKEA